MPEENQNMGVTQYQGASSPVSSLREETNAFNQYKTMMKSVTSKNLGLRRADEGKKLFESSLTAESPELCSQYDRACKASEMARGIRKYGESQGYDWSNVEDIPLLNQYSSLFPESGKIMSDYITRQDEDDPMPYYIKLGFEKPNEEDDAKNWLERTLSNWWWSFDKAGQGIRTMYNVKKNSDQRVRGNESGYREGAIQDYAYDVYGRNHPFSEITEEEWKNVERDLRLDPTLLDKYTNPKTGQKDILLGGTVSAINTTPLGLVTNATISGVAATKPGQTALGAVAFPVEKTGYFANKLPGLKQYRDGLSTEEDKKERDLYVGGEIRALISRGIIRNRKQLKSTVEGGGGGGGGGTGGWGSKLFENRQKQRRERLLKEGGLLGGEVGQGAIEQRGKVFETIGDTKTKGVKTYEELLERVRETGKEYLQQKKELLNKNKNTYGEKDLRLPKDVETVDGIKQVEENPVVRGLEAMLDKAIKEKSQAKVAKVNAYLEKINRGELTHADLEQLAADFGQEFKQGTFTEDGSIKNIPSAKVAAEIRDDIKSVSRKLADEAGVEGLSSKELQNADANYESYKTTEGLVDDLAESVNTARQKLLKRNLLQKVTGVVGDVLRKTGVDKLVRQMFGTSTRGETSLNFIEIEKQLPKWLDKIQKINEKLDRGATDAEILQEASLSPEGRVGITSVNGFGDAGSDSIFIKAQKAEKAGNKTLAKKLYNESVDAGANILKEAFGDQITVEKGMGRYGGSNEPTLYTFIKEVTPENIAKLADISENTFKQKSFFVAQKWNLPKGKTVKLGWQEGKPGVSNEVGVTIKLKKPLENMKDFDRILKQAGFDPQYEGATILPDGMGLEVYNLSAFNTDYVGMVRKIQNLLNNKLLQKYGIASQDRGYFQIQHLGIEGEAGALYDAIK